MAAAPGASDISPLLAGLVRLRVASGLLTGSALAAVVGSSQCHISAWLCGHKRLGVGLLDAVMCELGLSVVEVLASTPAPPVVAPARGVLVVMPRAKQHRSPWRRRVDPARIAADFLGEDGEAS
jgi:transcriptional regulator with XRE-family HTH domain